MSFKLQNFQASIYGNWNIQKPENSTAGILPLLPPLRVSFFGLNDRSNFPLPKYRIEPIYQASTKLAY